MRNDYFSSAAAGDGVALVSQILGEIALHLRGGFKRHRVETFKKLRQQTKAKTLHHARGFDSVLVILKALVRLEAGHPHVNARFGFVAMRVGFEKFAILRRFVVKQNNVNAMMMTRFRGGP